MIRRMLAVSAVAATALVGTLAAPPAEAAHVAVSIGLPGIGIAIGAPYAYGYGYGGYGYGYVAPRPVYAPYRVAYRPFYPGHGRWDYHHR